ncbi:MAG TPA: VWA domain-containing protein [Vicinamibacteria bacterium]|nr:VWA domain-containing protein [Vicinamibacteria bacterium]
MSFRSRAHSAVRALCPPALLFCVSLGPSPLEGGDARPRPTFASAVDVVNLNVSVTDVRDRHITGLDAADFKVFEDGVPQQLCLFTSERLPLSVAILVDSSLSMHARLPAVKAAALRLVRALGPEDEAEIVQFNHRYTALQEFTSDLGLLEKAVAGIKAEGATGVYNAIYLTLKDPRFRRKSDELIRQAVVVLSDGEDTSSLVNDDQVVALARKSNVTVYTISLTPQRTLLAADRTAADRATYFLTAVAKETGGRSYFPEGLHHLDGVYGRIADELRTQYALGYVSTNPSRDGEWRKINIATGQGDLLLRHKLGYYAGQLRQARRERPSAATSSATADGGLRRSPPAMDGGREPEEPRP